MLGTYRAAELVVTKHPLKLVKQELVARGQGVEIPLSSLSRAAVGICGSTVAGGR